MTNLLLVGAAGAGGMSLIAFLLVAVALVIGVVIAFMTWRTWPTFWLSVGLALLALGVIVNEVFVSWKHIVHD